MHFRAILRDCPFLLLTKLKEIDDMRCLSDLVKAEMKHRRLNTGKHPTLKIPITINHND